MRAFLFLGQFLTGCFLMGMLPLIATAAPRKENETPILVDLTGTRSLAEIKASGIAPWEMQGFTHSKVFHLPTAFVAWIFPGGTTIQHHMSIGGLTYRGGQLREIHSHGEMMPLDEVMVRARQFHKLLNEPTDALEKWAAAEGIKGIDGQSFSFGARNCNPQIDCSIRHSFGTIYPWILVLSASWLTDKEMKKPLPLPFTGAGLVDLDPPSGNLYTAAEDFSGYVEKHGQYPGAPRLWASAALVTVAVLIYFWQRKRRLPFRTDASAQSDC